MVRPRYPPPVHPCPCCGHITLAEPGNWEVCSACFWEDDGGRDPAAHSGPNHQTLAEGRANVRAFGACDRRFLKSVRTAPAYRVEGALIHQIDGGTSRPVHPASGGGTSVWLGEYRGLVFVYERTRCLGDTDVDLRVLDPRTLDVLLSTRLDEEGRHGVAGTQLVEERTNRRDGTRWYSTPLWGGDAVPIDEPDAFTVFYDLLEQF